MNFEVLSRQRARKMSFSSNIDDCIIVSITDTYSERNRFATNEHIKAVLHIQFDDVEKGETNCITQEQGKKIYDFVMSNKHLANKIIVHCEAGISRSSGVCAALMKIINGNDFDVFDNPRFTPNMTCYRTVLEQHFKILDEQDIINNEKHNIEVWAREFEKGEDER